MPILMFLTVSVYFFFVIWTIIVLFTFLGKVIEGPTSLTEPLFRFLFRLMFLPTQALSDFAKRELHIPCFLMRITYFLLALVVGIMGEQYRFYNTLFFVASRISIFYCLFGAAFIRRYSLLQVNPRSLPPDFHERSIYLVRSLALLNQMEPGKYLCMQQMALGINRRKWRTNIELPLPGSLSECEQLIIYQAAASGRTVDEQLQMLQYAVDHNCIPDPPNYYPSARTALNATAILWILTLMYCFFWIAYQSYLSGAPFFEIPEPSGNSISSSSLVLSTPEPAAPDSTSNQSQTVFPSNDPLYGATVYWVEGSNVFHLSEQCDAINQSMWIYHGSLDDAVDAGKIYPCSQCVFN